MLNTPILYLPCLRILDPDKLFDVFDTQGGSSELSIDHDLSCGNVSLLVKWVGWNIQLGFLNTK